MLFRRLLTFLFLCPVFCTRSFPCIWEPNTNAIILCETYKIDSPYDSVVPLKGAPEDKAGLERVVKVVRVVLPRFLAPFRLLNLALYSLLDAVARFSLPHFLFHPFDGSSMASGKNSSCEAVEPLLPAAHTASKSPPRTLSVFCCFLLYLADGKP